MNILHLRDAYACRETIYNAIWRSGSARRDPEMASIPVRAPEIEDWLSAETLEGDLTKGKANASSAGKLASRTSAE